ncbi:hypothetical protein A1O7_04272 [Cladophialophora yegresii CBS 114405]|uniref:Metallo-beta-lactamase domain-containing protein n=1 Tax=Cladophialophora yegresii CBS 114405 TaxID=1182544 RepID=W9W545_9EURO|nr:uncharacterized protein A1O7_04272 [Cladophialophora yegresii CBS 114405]EXJ60120.1 hypothetical protein A1O7_04272 [Cladophialophora yegresii CBS 114405]
MAQNLPHLPDWERLSTNIIRIMGGNPSKFTLQGTNTYLLGSGPSRILIDTGSGEKKWIDTVRAVLTSASASPKPLHISTCLLTHWHHDHIGGVTDLERLTADLNPGHELKVYKNLPTWNPDSLIDPSRVHDIHDGQEFVTAGGDGDGDDDSSSFAIQAIHTPGHAKDHMVFQITRSPDASEVGALFTADNVLGHGTAVFEDLQLYLQSLDVMKRRVVGARAYPGHGQFIDDAVGKIDEYIAHRRMREEEALNVLNDATGPKEVIVGKEWESMEMVRVIYRHYPENLWEPAEKGLLMVLEKLRRDGRVVRVGASGSEGNRGKWRVSEKAAL